MEPSLNDKDHGHPLNLKVIGATSFDSLLISWSAPKDCEVTAFDIYINDELLERVRDPDARKALLHPLIMQEEILITVCALDKCGVHVFCDEICIPPVSVPYITLHNTPVLPTVSSTPQLEALAQPGSSTQPESSTQLESSTQPESSPQPGSSTQPESSTPSGSSPKSGTPRQSGSSTPSGSSPKPGTPRQSGSSILSGSSPKPGIPRQSGSSTSSRTKI
ncbi:uncharacterized protein LOC142325157 [Lycorma delicatula]|uniref:uncharacterized protein LOC142325157 n=1 Tax=Lycorma delicatula TaxID=130591 RepID=UPI003F50E167